MNDYYLLKKDCSTELVKIKFSCAISSALDGSGWSDFHSNHFIPEERAPGTYHADPGTILDMVA
jgi:hypothetical protein